MVLAVMQVIWVQVFAPPRDSSEMMRMLVTTSFRPTVGLAVALVFLGHLMPPRIGAERIQARAGQFGPPDSLLCAVGVLGGVSLLGDWGGPVGMGIAVAGIAIAGCLRKPAAAADETVDE